MKRWVGIICVVVFAIFALADIVHEFQANEPIQYYAQQPRRLLFVAAIAIGGGFLVSAGEKLPPLVKSRIRLCAWGMSASIMTFAAFTFQRVFHMAARLQSGIQTFQERIWLPALLVLLPIAALFLWWKFYREWTGLDGKRRSTAKEP